MHVLEQALLWLDADRVRFWAVALAAFGVTCGFALRPGSSRGSAAGFAAGVCLTLAALHWPAWFYPGHLNPDEAQIVAGAITLDRFPVYWKYVDGTTHGPWCEYFLLAAHWLGAPLNYVTARAVGTLLQAASLLAAWGTLRSFTDERTARAGILPGLAFWSFVCWDDFLHYATELPGVFFLSISGWLAARALVAPAPGRRHLWLAGAAGFGLGAVPLAKLQLVPAGGALALVVLGILWRGRTDLPAPQRCRLAGAFVAGGLLPAAGLLAFLAIYGLEEHFRASYLLSALDYVALGENRATDMPGRFLHFSATEPGFAWLFWGTLGFALLYARTATTAVRRAACAGAWLLLGFSLYGVLRPGREVPHYLHTLVIPLTLLAGLSLAIALDEPSPPSRAPWRQRLPWGWFLALLLFPQGYNRLTGHPNEHVGHFAAARRLPPSAAAVYLREHAGPGDSIAMWGWEPHLLVEVGLPHGTREAHTANQIMVWPLRPYYVTRYLWDMERHQPEWFVDAVGPDAFVFKLRPSEGHESVPALRDLIAARYEFMGEIDGKRIYRRKAAPVAPRES